MNEGGLLCYRDNPVCLQNGFREDQANYAIRTYTRTWANGLLGMIWFTLNGPGWQGSGLLDENQQPRPAFIAIKFLSTTLQGASYVGQLSNGGIEGYAFRKGTRTYHIYWKNDLSTSEILLPVGTLAVYDKLGQQISGITGTLLVSYEPRIVEIN